MALNKKIINFETKAQFQSANGINTTAIQQSLSDCVNVANVGKCIGNIPWRSIVTIQDTHEIWTHGVYIGGYIDNNTIYLGGKSINLQTFGNSNYVTLNTVQTITANKTFTGGVQFKGSNEAHAIVTDNDANLVFDTINNQVYTGDTSLLLASFRNGGNIYGQLTAIPNEVTGLYYNSYRLLTNLDFTDVFSTTEYPVNVTIGNITRKISGSVLKTSLGLGSLAFRNNLLQSDIPLLDASIIVSGEFPNSRIQNPQITIAGKVVTLGSEITANELLTLLNLTSAMHFVGISTTDPKTSGATVNGVSTWKAGDIVLYNTKEYILTSDTNSKDNWTELGDESSYALKNHTHDYLPLTGGTINGNLIVNGNTTFKGSTSYSAIVTDGGSNIVFDTLNNIVYTGDTLLLLASFKNGGTTYGTLTAAPNQPTGLYYNGYKIITTNDFIDLFDDLYSNTEYLINVVVGGVTKRITTSTIKTNLGLGQLAFKNTLSYLDVGAAAQNHTHNYLSLSGGTVTGQLYLTGLDDDSSDITDNTEILTSYASNNGFADSNAVGKIYRRDAICIYDYLKGKLDSVYSSIDHTHNDYVTDLNVNGNYLTWTKNGTTSNITIPYASSAGAVAWENITEKPDSFTPSSHTHDYLPLTGGTCTGDIYATAFYSTSDIRLKNIKSEVVISAEDLAKLPLFNFIWNNQTNNKLFSGTSAQDVLKILPTVISYTEEYYQLDYATLGTIAGITACKELITQKSEIELLKDRVKQLEQKLKMYNVND